MRKVYDVITAVRNHFEYNDTFTNKVVFGDIDDVDLNKVQMFPLTQFWMQNSTFNRRTIQFTLNFLFLDVVDDDNTNIKGGLFDLSKSGDSFFGNSNFIDVLNQQHSVATDFLVSLTDYRGELAEQKYVLIGEPSAEMLYEKFENKLAGWGVSVTIEVPNDTAIC